MRIGIANEEATLRIRLRTIRLLAWSVLLEAVLILVAFSPINVNSTEIRNAHHRYVSNPSETTRREYKKTVARVLWPEHTIQESAAVLAIVNLPVTYLLIRRIRARSEVVQGKR